jgi:hypothetical protein
LGRKSAEGAAKNAAKEGHQKPKTPHAPRYPHCLQRIHFAQELRSIHPLKFISALHFSRLTHMKGTLPYRTFAPLRKGFKMGTVEIGKGFKMVTWKSLRVSTVPILNPFRLRLTDRSAPDDTKGVVILHRFYFA